MKKFGNDSKNKIVDDNIEEIMKEEKTIYGDHGEIIFSQPRYYQYVLDDQHTEEEIMNEYLKWYHEFYGESGNKYNNRFSDKNVIEKFKCLTSNKIMKLPVIVKCTFYFASDGTKDGNYSLYETDENGHYTNKKTGEYPCYRKPWHIIKELRDIFPNGNMLMASEITGTYGPAIYICKVKRVT
jgi:hypothetical protein